jgi:hypothetical protein
MVGIAQMLDHALGKQFDSEPLKILAIFSGTGLAVSLLLASYGINLSPELF